jgi:hypothetical protein
MISLPSIKPLCLLMLASVHFPVRFSPGMKLNVHQLGLKRVQIETGRDDSGGCQKG